VTKKISKQKANDILMGGSIAEPTIDINNYNNSMSKALMYYNNSYSLSDYKNACLEYAVIIGMDISKAIPEYNFRSIGAVCRLILRDCTLRADDIQRAIDKLTQIQTEYEKSKTSNTFVLELPPIIKIDYHVVDYVNSIEDVLIDSILKGTRDVDVTKYIAQFTTNEYSKTQSKEISKFIKSKLDYYNDVYKLIKEGCEDTKESFGTIPSIRIKNVSKALDSLLAGINTVQIAEKVVKQVRKKKETPALVQVKDIPYLKTWESLEGLHPSTVIGCSEIWVWDTEKRDVHVMRVLKDFKFTAKGQTFLNIDEEKSFKKKLRKPEDVYLFTNTLEDPTKKTMLATFNTIKTTQQKTSGRMSSNKLILKAFK
jgi:hypothetical protein